MWLVCNSHDCCQKNGEHTPLLCHNTAVTTKTTQGLLTYVGKLSLSMSIFFLFYSLIGPFIIYVFVDSGSYLLLENKIKMEGLIELIYVNGFSVFCLAIAYPGFEFVFHNCMQVFLFSIKFFILLYSFSL